jgi:hypothetical protein
MMRRWRRSSFADDGGTPAGGTVTSELPAGAGFCVPGARVPAAVRPALGFPRARRLGVPERYAAMRIWLRCSQPWRARHKIRCNRPAR